MPTAQGNRKSQRSQCQQKKLLSDQDMDRAGLYRLRTAAESLKPVCIHTAGFSKQFFPWGGAEQHSTVQSVQHAQWLHCVYYSARQRDQIWWEKEDGKKTTAKGTPVSESLIRYSSSAVLIHTTIYLVCRCVPGCCRSCCDSNRSGMWGCKFLLHLFFLSLSFQPVVLIQIIYFTVRAVIHCSVLITFSSFFPSLFLSYLYATFRHSADHRE